MSKYKLVEVDHIISLPDELVERILSFLPIKEAMAASVLSKRWLSLWTSSIHLDFDAAKTLDFFSDWKIDLREQKIAQYVRWVNRVVEQHTGPIIETFRACFPDITREYANSIDKWIEFALEKRVQVLMLDFVQLYDDDKIYIFPSRLLGLGEGSDLKPHVGFKYLKVLLLDSVYVGEGVVENFLSHCPSLERLSLTLLENLKELRVVGPSIRLKYLTLASCFGCERIEICDTNLVSFVYFGGWVDTILKNVPCLVEAAACSFLALCPPIDFMNLTFSKLSCCLSQLESLVIEINDAHYNKDYVFPTLPNLKQMELEADPDYEWNLSQLSSLMKATPSLQRLVLKLFSWPRNEEKEINEAAKCPHHNLKVVEVVGYRSRTNVIKHVMYVIDNSIALKRIVIDPVYWWKMHHSGADREKDQAQEEVAARHHALHSLKERVPSTIELICLEGHPKSNGGLRSKYK